MQRLRLRSRTACAINCISQSICSYVLLLCLTVPPLSSSIATASTFRANATSSSLPHIIHIVADDLGYSYVDWHRTNASIPRTLTPHLNALRRRGITLDRHYAFQYCSPSRSALLSGRNPISVNVQNVVPEVTVTLPNPSSPHRVTKVTLLNKLTVSVGSSSKAYGIRLRFQSTPSAFQ